MAKAEKRYRRWLQVRLSTLLIFVALLCMFLGWQANQARRQRHVVAVIEKLGGSVEYDYQYPAGPWRNVLDVDYTWDCDRSAKPPGPKWLRGLIGDEYFVRVVSANLFSAEVVSDDDLKAIGKLTSLRELILGYEGPTDEGIRNLLGLKELRAGWFLSRFHRCRDQSPATIVEAGDARFERLRDHGRRNS
ncbi:MAG TPA: hypothetical protein VGN42_00025 [Pirellulales bacterium]|nr:hypothetical protein [Pirellulales bacterium]